jgi:hypothetical protein
MLPTFEGKIVGGKLEIPELDGSMRTLEGKRLAIITAEPNSAGQLASGKLLAGVFEKGKLNLVEGELKQFEGKSVFIVVRHELQIRHQVFDQKYQLGAKIGDLDK